MASKKARQAKKAEQRYNREIKRLKQSAKQATRGKSYYIDEDKLQQEIEKIQKSKKQKVKAIRNIDISKYTQKIPSDLETNRLVLDEFETTLKQGARASGTPIITSWYYDALDKYGEKAVADALKAASAVGLELTFKILYNGEQTQWWLHQIINYLPTIDETQRQQAIEEIESTMLYQDLEEQVEREKRMKAEARGKRYYKV